MRILHPKLTQLFMNNALMRMAKAKLQQDRAWRDTLTASERLNLEYGRGALVTFPIHAWLLSKFVPGEDPVFCTLATFGCTLVWPIGIPFMLTCAWFTRKKRQHEKNHPRDSTCY